MYPVLNKALRYFQVTIFYIQRTLLRHPKSVFTTSILMFVLCLAGASKIRVGIRAEDWLDKRLESTQLYLDLKKTFGSEDKLTWIVPTPWNSTELCKQQQRYYNWSAQQAGLDKISSIFELRYPDYKPQKLELHYPRVFSEQCRFEQSDIQRALQHPMADLFTIQSRQDLIFNFVFEELEHPNKWGSTDLEEASNWIAHLKKLEPSSLFGGTLFFQNSTKEGIQWSGKLNILTALIIIACVKIFLGTWLAGVILALLIIFTTSFLQAGMALRGNLVDPLSSSLFIIMTIAIVEDFFFSFFLARIQKLRLRTALRRMSIPSFFTSLTTAIGLGSLAASDNMSVQNMGFWTGIGAMFEWSLVYFLLPALCRLFPKLDYLPQKGRIFFPNWFRSVGSFSPSRRVVICLLLPLFLIFFVYDKVNINYSPFDMFPQSHPLVEFRDYVKEHRGFEGEVSLVFNHENLTPEDSQLIEEAAKHPLVAAHKNPFKMTQELMPPEADGAIQRMIDREISSTTSMSDFIKDGKSRALLFVREFDIQSLEQLSQHIEKVCQGRCYVSGEIVAFKDYALSMLRTLYSSFSYSLMSVSVLLILLSIAVSGRIFWPLVISSVWAPLMLMIFVSLFQIKINVVTCLALDLMIGLSGDNAVQFLLYDRKGRWKRGHTELLPVGLMIVTTIAFISLVLLLSYFKTAQTLSGLMEFGAILMLVGDLWILNYFTEVKEPNANKG